ncbi:hypothetical protein MRX96_030704 [Rhipicephalus microplus]
MYRKRRNKIDGARSKCPEISKRRAKGKKCATLEAVKRACSECSAPTKKQKQRICGIENLGKSGGESSYEDQGKKVGETRSDSKPTVTGRRWSLLVSTVARPPA